jgi:hypothetical protein
MDKWIFHLERNAGYQSAFKTYDGYLLSEDSKDCGYSESQCIEYDPKVSDEIDLNGTFKIDELEKLLKHMKQYNKG